MIEPSSTRSTSDDSEIIKWCAVVALSRQESPCAFSVLTKHGAGTNSLLSSNTDRELAARALKNCELRFQSRL